MIDQALAPLQLEIGQAEMLGTRVCESQLNQQQWIDKCLLKRQQCALQRKLRLH
jgi:hypothetical protein